MEKVVRYDGKEFEFDGCFGCAIVNNQLPSYPFVVWENENFVVVQDFELPIKGMMIISTKRHIESIVDLTKEESSQLIKIIRSITSLEKNICKCDEVTIVQEQKKGYHFHVWILPTLPWMKEKFGKVLKNIKDIQEYAKRNFRDEKSLAEIAKVCKLLKSTFRVLTIKFEDEKRK